MPPEPYFRRLHDENARTLRGSLFLSFSLGRSRQGWQLGGSVAFVLSRRYNGPIELTTGLL
jgi:hypothetical protein